jgi:hypothetical protein
MEEGTPHDEESAGWRNPGILAAGESPKRFLRRRRWQFGERRSGWKKRPKGIFTPTPPFIG